MQGTRGIKGPSTATPGTTIEVEVQNGATVVEAGILGSGEYKEYPVGPDGKARIDIPVDPSRGTLIVTAGRFPDVARLRIILESK
jgi:hypothetical protein